MANALNSLQKEETEGGYNMVVQEDTASQAVYQIVSYGAVLYVLMSTIQSF